jgi:hypothetical protein
MVGLLTAAGGGKTEAAGRVGGVTVHALAASKASSAATRAPARRGMLGNREQDGLTDMAVCSSELRSGQRGLLFFSKA